MCSQLDQRLTPSLRVLGMPELMRFICDLVTKRDILALLRVCRQLYCNVAPLIWETIDDISVLIKLIPDVETLSDGTYIRFTVR